MSHTEPAFYIARRNGMPLLHISCSWKCNLQEKGSKYQRAKRVVSSEPTHLITVWPTQMTTLDYCVGKTNVKNVNIGWGLYSACN